MVQFAFTGYNLLLLGTICCHRVQTAVTGYNLLLQFVPQSTQVHHCHAEPHLQVTLCEHVKAKHCLHSTRNALHCGTDKNVCRHLSSETTQLRPEGSHNDSESVYACRGSKPSTSQISDNWCKRLCPAQFLLDSLSQA